MNSPAKLTDTQFVILSEASQRKDRCLIPPKTLKAAAAMTAGDRPRETVSPARQRGAGVAPGGTTSAAASRARCRSRRPASVGRPKFGRVRNKRQAAEFSSAITKETVHGESV